MSQDESYRPPPVNQNRRHKGTSSDSLRAFIGDNFVNMQADSVKDEIVRAKKREITAGTGNESTPHPDITDLSGNEAEQLQKIRADSRDINDDKSLMSSKELADLGKDSGGDPAPRQEEQSGIRGDDGGASKPGQQSLHSMTGSADAQDETKGARTSKRLEGDKGDKLDLDRGTTKDVSSSPLDKNGLVGTPDEEMANKNKKDDGKKGDGSSSSSGGSSGGRGPLPILGVRSEQQGQDYKVTSTAGKRVAAAAASIVAIVVMSIIAVIGGGGGTGGGGGIAAAAALSYCDPSMSDIDPKTNTKLSASEAPTSTDDASSDGAEEADEEDADADPSDTDSTSGTTTGTSPPTATSTPKPTSTSSTPTSSPSETPQALSFDQHGNTYQIALSNGGDNGIPHPDRDKGDGRPTELQSATFTLNQDQIGYAIDILNTTEEAGLGEDAAVVAMVTALQESTLRNLDVAYDHDSLGLYQQRPASDYGAPEQILDPRLGTLAFYGLADHTQKPGLVDIEGWQDMPLTVAAQAVQISGHPDAYAKWEDDAKSIVEQLGGKGLKNNTPGSYKEKSKVCSGSTSTAQCFAAANSGGGGDSKLTEGILRGMKPDTVLVTQTIEKEYGYHTFYGYREPDGYDYHFNGVAVDIMVEPNAINPDIPLYKTPEGVAHGDAMAAYLQDNADQLGVEYLIWKQAIWMSGTPNEAWDPMPDRRGDTANHYDHIHANTFGDSATGGAGAAGATCTSIVDSNGAIGTLNAEGMSPPSDIDKVVITQAFHSGHNGTDIGSNGGAQVDLYSISKSTVVDVVTGCAPMTRDSGCGGGWGNHVVLDFGNGVGARYAHLSEVSVAKGDSLEAGQSIGKMGNSGDSFGVHLHFEQLDMNNGMSRVDPTALLTKSGL